MLLGPQNVSSSGSKQAPMIRRLFQVGGGGGVPAYLVQLEGNLGRNRVPWRNSRARTVILETTFIRHHIFPNLANFKSIYPDISPKSIYKCNKHLERCSMLQATTETRIKMPGSYYYTPTRMVQIKKSTTATPGRTWTTELTPLVDDNAATLQTELLKRPNTELPFDPTIPLLTFTHKGNENRCPDRNLYTNVHSGIIRNSSKVETSQMSINGGMEKQNVL